MINVNILNAPQLNTHFKYMYFKMHPKKKKTVKCTHPKCLNTQFKRSLSLTHPMAIVKYSMLKHHFLSPQPTFLS